MGRPYAYLEPAAPALRYAEQHLFKRRSVVQDHDVLAETLRQGRGRITRRPGRGADPECRQ
jgi:hypothetical protein